MYKSIFFFKILVACVRYQFQLGPIFSLCNAASSAVLFQLIVTAHLEELDTTQTLITSPQSLSTASGHVNSLSLGRVETIAIWRMGSSAVSSVL